MMNLFLAVALACAPLAQQPARDTVKPIEGTGRISGTVTAADTGQPIRRATVRLTRPGGPIVTTSTDASGRFEFGDLPAGRVTVTVFKAGFVQPSLGYGSPPAGEPVRAIDLAPGQRLDKVHIRMMRGGVVTGRVLDEFGDPLPEAFVQVFRASYAQGIRRLMAVRGASANDIGQFRVYGLPSGTYYISGTIRPSEMASQGEPAPIRVTDASGRGFAPTFYPGVASPSDARPIAIEAGQEISSLEFVLQLVRLVRISGTVVDSQGRPAAGYVAMLNSARGDSVVMGAPIFAETAADGRFSIAGVAPGQYRLDVRAKAEFESVATTGRVEGVGQSPSAAEIASVPVTVATEDLDGVLVTTSRGHVVSGRVVVEGGTIAELKGPKGVRVATYDAGAGASVSAVLLMAFAPIQPDGTFDVRGLSGTRVIRADGLPVGWALKAVRAGGVDITDTGLEIRGADPDIEVIVARATNITGTVTDARGTPVAGKSVVIFPEDRSRWSGFMNRYVLVTRAADDGTFNIAAVPAGTYLAAIVDRVADEEWLAPENLERLRSSATRLAIAEGETKTVRLIVNP